MSAAPSPRFQYPSVRPVLAAFACAFAPGDRVKLSGPLAQPIGGSVGYVLSSPDGSRIVYRGDQEVDERRELYSVPSDGSAPPVKLSDPSRGDVVSALPRLAPDGVTVVYVTDEPALFRVPIDGTAPPVELAAGIAFPDLFGFRFEISADGAWVVFPETEPPGLRAVPLAGGQAPISLAPGTAVIAPDFALSADSARVVFRGGASEEALELFGVPIDGSAPPVRLNAPLAGLETVADFALTPDGLRAVALQHDREVDGYGVETPVRYRLWSVPLDGSAAPTDLGGAFADEVTVALAAAEPITPDSARVLYRADVRVRGRAELYSVAVGGGSAPVRLNAEHDPGDPVGVQWGTLSPDGGRVLYRYGGELFGVALDRPGAAVRLCAAGAFVESLAFLPDGARVVYEARLAGRDVSDLFVVRTDGALEGGGPPWIHPRNARRIVRLAQDVLDFRVHPGGATVLYSRTPEGVYRVDVAGGDSVQLFAPWAGYAVTPGDRVVISPFSFFPEHEPGLYSVPLAGGDPVVLNLPLPLGPIVGRIHDFAVSPDGAWTVYLADGEEETWFQLYSVPSDGSAPVRKISDDYGQVGGYDPMPGAFRITPDGTRVVYASVAGRGGTQDLFVAPLDGSSPPARLADFETHDGVEHGFEVAPDGSCAVFLAVVPTGQFSVSRRLFGVRLDGTAPPVLLSGAGPGNVWAFGISPDSARVVYRSDEQVVGRHELFSVPIEGGTPVELHAVTVPSHGVGDFRISLDSARVVYLFDGSVSDLLFTVPIDGSAAPQQFAPLGRPVFDFELTPDGSGVVYGMSFSTSGPGLFLAPLDASSWLPLTPLPPAGPYQTARALRIGADGTRVAYLADQESDDVSELFTVPLDGSQQLVKLSPPLPAGATIHRDLRLSADGSRVLFFADADTVGVRELYSAPLAGGAPAERLNGPIPAGGGFELPIFTPHEVFALAERRVAFQLDGEVAGRVELYLARADGSGETVRVNGPILGGVSEELPCAFAGPDRIVYLAPEEIPGVPELFAVSLGHVPPHRRR